MPEIQNITYREYEANDENGIIDLFNSVFKKQLNKSIWEWEYKHNPIKKTICLLAFDEKKLVAQSAAIPLIYNIEGKGTPAARIQNVMCHKDYRNKGIFLNTLKKLTEIIPKKNIDFIITFPNNYSIHTFVNKLNYTHLADIYTYSLVVEKIKKGHPYNDIKIEISARSELSPTDIQLIETQLKNHKIHQYRSNNYFNWRYDQNPANKYSFVRIHEGEEQQGLIVCKYYAEAASIDLLEFFITPNKKQAVDAALSAIIEYFQDKPLKTINIWLMEHYSYYKQLIDMGFHKTDLTTHLLYLPLSQNSSACYNQLNSYYLSMGDSDVY